MFAANLVVLDLWVDFSAVNPALLAMGIPDNSLNLTCLPHRHITAF